MGIVKWVEKKRIFLMIAVVLLVAAAALAGCEKGSSGTNGEEETGDGGARKFWRQLQVSFAASRDVGDITVQLYRGTDNTGSLVSEAELGPEQRIALFDNLEAEAYWIEARANNLAGSLSYSGQGGVSVLRDIPYLLNILMNPDCEGEPDGGVDAPICMEIPRIDAVSVEGRTALARDMDPDVSGDWYVAAVFENEPLKFNVSAFHPQDNPLTFIWEVKDGPGLSGSDVGDIPSYSPDGRTAIWLHDQEGAYYVLVHVGDDDGGATSFIFNVYVWEGQKYVAL